MAKAAKSAQIEKNQVQEGEEPKVFRQARERWGENPDYWQIWVKNAYKDWKSGAAPAPEGDLDELFKKTKADE